MSQHRIALAAWKIVAIKHLFEASHQGGLDGSSCAISVLSLLPGGRDGSMNVPSSSCSLGQQSGLPANTIDIGHIDVFGV